MLEFKVYKEFTSLMIFVTLEFDRINGISEMLEFLLVVKSWKYISSEFILEIILTIKMLIVFLANIDLQ